MKRQGQLVRWESARGFGFIRSPDISADVFVHPAVGMALRFEEIHVGSKGPRAVAVEAIGATLRRPASPPPPMSAAARRHPPVAPECAGRRLAGCLVRAAAVPPQGAQGELHDGLLGDGAGAHRGGRGWVGRFLPAGLLAL